MSEAALFLVQRSAADSEDGAAPRVVSKRAFGSPDPRDSEDEFPGARRAAVAGPQPDACQLSSGADEVGVAVSVEVMLDSLVLVSLPSSDEAPWHAPRSASEVRMTWSMALTWRDSQETSSWTTATDSSTPSKNPASPAGALHAKHHT